MRGASWDVGSHGAAIKLDGKTNYAMAPEIKGNPYLLHFTVCIWAKFASTTSGGSRQYLLDTATHSFFLLVDEAKNGKSVKMDSGWAELYSGELPIKLHSFNHYCVTQNRKNKRVELYMDGKMVKSGNTAGTSPLALGHFKLGTYSGATGSQGNYFVHGSMCGFRIYTRVLTQKDISMLYDGGACF